MRFGLMTDRNSGEPTCGTSARWIPSLKALPRQASPAPTASIRWVNGFGIGLASLHGWKDLIDQAICWSGRPQSAAANLAVEFNRKYLAPIETSPLSVELWRSLCSDAQ